MYLTCSRKNVCTCTFTLKCTNAASVVINSPFCNNKRNCVSCHKQLIITVLFEIWCHWLTPFFTQTAEDHDVNKPEGLPCTPLVRWTILVRKMSTNVWNWTISDVISQEHRNIFKKCFHHNFFLSHRSSLQSQYCLNKNGKG